MKKSLQNLTKQVIPELLLMISLNFDVVMRILIKLKSVHTFEDAK